MVSADKKPNRLAFLVVVQDDPRSPIYFGWAVNGKDTVVLCQVSGDVILRISLRVATS